MDRRSRKMRLLNLYRDNQFITDKMHCQDFDIEQPINNSQVDRDLEKRNQFLEGAL